MKFHILIAVVALAAPLAFAHDIAEMKDKPLLTDEDREGYAVGISVGRNLVHQGIDVKLEAFMRGFKDAMSNKPSVLSLQESRDAMAALNVRSQSKRQKAASESTGKNTREGRAFLAANKKKEGVTTLPSGLQYQILTPGSGPKPTTQDRVVTHYRGTLIDGTEFDSSYARGRPATFPVTGVIRGWTEALQLMKVGAKWELFIPPELAYGARGSGNSIGPHATLIFEIELLEIK